MRERQWRREIQEAKMKTGRQAGKFMNSMDAYQKELRKELKKETRKEEAGKKERQG